MTLPFVPCRRPFGVTLALATAVLAIGTASSPVPAEARGNSPFYRAELVQPTDKTLEIVRGTPWQCNGSVCVAPKAGSRPVNVCKNFVREFGEIASFTADGEALEAAEMAKCQPA